MEAANTIEIMVLEEIISRFKESDKFRQIAANAGWLFVDKILRMGVGVFVSIWVARYLGPLQFGNLNYAMAFVGLFGAFATLGLDGIVVRNIIKEPGRKEEILGSAFILKLIGGISALVISYSLVWAIRTDDILTIWLVGIIAIGFVFQAFDVIDLYFQSRLQSKYTVYARNSAFVIVSILKIFLILNEAPLIAFAWAALAEIIMGSIFLIAAYRINKHCMYKWRMRGQMMKQLLMDSWPLILSGLSIMLYMKIDQIMLGEMIGNKGVGIYSAATRISELWYFIPVIISASFFPYILQAKKMNDELYYARLEELFGFVALIAFSIAIPLSFLSTRIVLFCFGDNFVAAGPVLAIHIWAAPFVFLGVIQGNWDLTENLTKLSLYRTSAGAVINIVLNYFLIPLYSALGAAIATVISYSFSAYLFNCISRKTRPIFICQTRSLLFIRYIRRLL